MGQDEPEAVLLLRVSLAGAHAVSVLCAREGADRREVQHAALAVVRLAPFVAARPGKHRVERPQAPAVHLSAREAAQSRTARYLFGCLALNVHVLEHYCTSRGPGRPFFEYCSFVFSAGR